MTEHADDRPQDRPRADAGKADPDDLFNALGIAVAAIGLASDGELVKQNTYGLREIMGRLAGHLDRIVGREIDARGLDRSDTYARFDDALDPFRREGGGDERPDPPGDAGAPNGDTVTLPRELAERLVRQVGLLRAADCTLADMSPRDFIDVEVARRTVREYAARLVGTLRDLEERLGYTDGDALTDRLNEEEEVMEAAKRRELAEELEGGDS